MGTGKRLATNASEYKHSWGHTIYHELMHLDPVIANEEVWDITYGACTVAKLANQNGCSGDTYLWDPPGWDYSHGDPHSLLNADSWAFFASGVYFQKATNLNAPGEAINDCGIYGGSNANFTQRGLEYAVEGILLPTIDRADGTYNNTTPPDPASDNIPLDDPPTPPLPYTLSPLPSNLAMPFDAVAYFATYTSASAVSSPTSACSGNQIEGSCVQATLPSTTPDSGPKSPVCNKVDSPLGDFVLFDATKAASAAATYCAALISSNVVLSGSSPAPKPGYVANAAENGGYIAFTVAFDVDSCAPGTASANQQLSFSALGQDLCYQSLYTALAASCEYSRGHLQP
jgi:hypothetical protein